MNSFLQEWLQKKSESQYVIPNLRSALRNSKEIISFAKTLEPEHKAGEKKKLDLKDMHEFVSSITSEDKKKILKAIEDTNVKRNNVPECGLPDPNWPKSDLLTPTNQSYGCPVPDPIVSLSLEALRIDVKKCFDKLESPKVLIIVLSPNIPKKLFKIIKELRTKAPLVVDENFVIGKSHCTALWCVLPQIVFFLHKHA